MKLDNFNANASVNVPVTGEVFLKAQHLEETSSDNRGGDYSRNRTSRTIIDGLEVSVIVYDTKPVNYDIDLYYVNTK